MQASKHLSVIMSLSITEMEPTACLFMDRVHPDILKRLTRMGITWYYIPVARLVDCRKEKAALSREQISRLATLVVLLDRLTALGHRTWVSCKGGIHRTLFLLVLHGLYLGWPWEHIMTLFELIIIR